MGQFGKESFESSIGKFLKEYSLNDEASKNYRVLKPPSRGYQDYQISLTYAKYHGDPDVNVMVIFNVVLNYGNSKKSYRVEQVFMFVDEPAKSIEEGLANVKNWYMGWIEF